MNTTPHVLYKQTVEKIGRFITRFLCIWVHDRCALSPCFIVKIFNLCSCLVFIH